MDSLTQSLLEEIRALLDGLEPADPERHEELVLLVEERAYWRGRIDQALRANSAPPLVKSMQDALERGFIPPCTSQPAWLHPALDDDRRCVECKQLLPPVSILRAE